MYRLIFPALSCALFAAHLLFHGLADLAPLPGALFLVMLTTWKWVRVLMMGSLALMGLEWLRTAWVLVSDRMASGEDWMRAGLIVLACALWTWASAWVFQTPALRARYRRTR